jgi:hypothetical protein
MLSAVLLLLGVFSGAIQWETPSTSAAALAVTTINFNDRPEGTRITDQYPGVRFPDGGFIRSTQKGPLATQSPPQFLEKNCFEFDSAPLRIQFTSGQGWVGVYVGNPENFEQPIVLRAYDAMTGGRLIGTVQATLGARANVTTLLQTCRAVDRDIRRVEISLGDSCEIIDDLSFDPNPVLGTLTTANFDDRPEFTRITTQYRGLEFPDAPWIRTAASMSTTTISPPNVLEQYSFGGEFDPPPLRVTLTRSQAWVRTYVRSVFGFARVTMRAYSLGGRGGVPIVTTYADFSGATPVTTPLEICRLVERDITRVEIEHATEGFEVIDNFQFAGTSAPPPPSDSQAPRVFIDAPRTGDFFYGSDLRVRGRITENRGLERVTLVHEQLDGSGRREDTTFLRVVSGRAPNFTFEFNLRLLPGQNRIRIEAFDTAGNRSTNAERETIVTLAPPMQVIIDSPRPSQVFSRSPITVEGRVRKQFGTLPRDRVRFRLGSSGPFAPVDEVLSSAPEFRFRTQVILASEEMNTTNSIFVEAVSEDGVVARGDVTVLYSLPDVTARLEATQATYEVNLIAEKKTVVRVYVYPDLTARWLGGGDVHVRRVRLIGRREGVDLPGSPLVNDRDFTVRLLRLAPDLERSDAGNSFNFVLPQEWTREGELELTAEINPDRSLLECGRCYENNAQRMSVRFSGRKVLRLLPVKVQLSDGTIISDSDIGPALEGIRRAYPVSELRVLAPQILHTSVSAADLAAEGDRYKEATKRILREVTNTFTCYRGIEDVDSFFGAVWAWLSDCGWDTYVVGLVPAVVGEGCPGGIAWVNGPASMTEASPWVAAQEVGHNLGREHAGNDHGESEGGGVDGRFPYPHGRIGAPGFDTEAMLAIPQSAPFPPGVPTLSGPCREGADHAHDFMSYGGGPFWISPYTWRALANHPFRGSLRGAVPRSVEPRALVQSGSGAYLHISGQIHEDGRIELFPFYTGRLPAGASVIRGEGRYSVELQAPNGQVLFAGRFDPTELQHDPTKQISTVVPFPTGTARIVFKDGERILATRDVSARAPQVRLLSPNGREVWGPSGTQRIVWMGSDADGDVVSYVIRYSADGGRSWLTLGDWITDTSLEVDVAGLAGSSRAMIQVVASDGINTSRDTSDATFTVETKPPFVLILAPTNGSLATPGQRIRLEATASDHEDGELPDSALRWSSDKDGPLGVGRMLDVSRLSPGIHTITLSAKDGTGQEGRASITVRVATQVELNSEAGLEGSVDTARRVDTKSGITVGNGPKVGQPPREQVVRGFVSFDLTRLPRGVEIVQAQVDYFQKGITGDPYFKGLGAVVVDAVDYGSSLDADDFDAPAVMEKIGTLSDNGLLEFKGLDVTEAVKTALANGRSRVQFRLRFSKETDDDSNIDTVVFEAAAGAANAATAPKLRLLVAPVR